MFEWSIVGADITGYVKERGEGRRCWRNEIRFLLFLAIALELR